MSDPGPHRRALPPWPRTVQGMPPRVRTRIGLPAVLAALIGTIGGCGATGGSRPTVSDTAGPSVPLDGERRLESTDGANEPASVRVAGFSTSVIEPVAATITADDEEASVFAVEPLLPEVVDEATPLPAPVPDDTIDGPVEGPDEVSEFVAFPLVLDEVLTSIYSSYPLLESAHRERDVRIGERLSASGAFDTKLKGESLNQPVGFYRTYRQKIGVEQPLYGGGTAFTQYRIGRGQFEPWYQERNTNDGGEVKAGVIVPLLQGRRIDERRAELFKANVELESVEPEIRGQLLEFVRLGTIAYWDWVAAGRNVEIAESLLKNALDRTDGLGTRVDEGDLEPIALVDNDRLLASRRAKLVDAERKLRQTAVKLSLYLRDAGGRPFVPTDDRLPSGFPDPLPGLLDNADFEIARAIDLRPEMAVVDFDRRRAEIELDQACNLTDPQLDAGITGSQDVGAPTSSKRDKSRLELEAGLALEVPLQRRKARGKVLQSRAKLAQINAKRRFTMDKIAVEVRDALIAVDATYRRYEQARTAQQLAERMRQAEQDAFDLGSSDLFLLNAREQQAAEAATDVVSALADHFRALADYRAAIGDLQPVGAP